MRRTTSFPDQRGYTFMEFLVASTFLLPLVMTLCLMLESMQRGYSKGEQKADRQQSARIAMGRIVRELRAAGLDPETVISRLLVPAAIQTAEVSRIAFIADDPKRDGKSLKIEYRLDLTADPPVLRRQQWSWSTSNNGWTGASGAQPLAERITGLELTYYGADGNAIPSSELSARLGEIQRVGLIITAGSPPNQIPPETYRLVCEVRMRNVGL